MDVRCIQRLVSAYCPHLKHLIVITPVTQDPEMASPGMSVLLFDVKSMFCMDFGLHSSGPSMEFAANVDLSACLTLKWVQIEMLPEFMVDRKASEVLRAMLSSWRAEVPVQFVGITPYCHNWFTRQEYADLLSTVGRVLEEWLGDVAGAANVNEAFSEHNIGRRVVIYIKEWGSWEDWWWKHVQECFPTFARLGGLEVMYEMRKSFPMTDMLLLSTGFGASIS